MVMTFLQMRKDLIGAVDNQFGHTRHFCHMNTKAVLAAAAYQFAHKYHIVVHFFYGNIEIFDA